MPTTYFHKPLTENEKKYGFTIEQLGKRGDMSRQEIYLRERAGQLTKRPNGYYDPNIDEDLRRHLETRSASQKLRDGREESDYERSTRKRKEREVALAAEIESQEAVVDSLTPKPTPEELERAEEAELLRRETEKLAKLTGTFEAPAIDLENASSREKSEFISKYGVTEFQKQINRTYGPQKR